MEAELSYIYEIYKTGSFSKASENLYMTQPALSIAVKKIEKNIGMSLFDRSKHPLALTEAGKVYIQSIEKMMLLEEEMNNQINDLGNLVTGTLRIGGSHYVNSYILPNLLVNYSNLYPGVKIELMEASAAHLSRMLEEKNIDITFSCNELFLKNFKLHKAFSDTILLAVNKESPANAGLEKMALTYNDIKKEKHKRSNCPTTSLKSFKNAPFILLTPGNNLHNRALQMFADEGVEPNVKLETPQLVTSYHLAAADFGATFVCDRIITNKDFPVLYYKLNSPLADRQFYALLNEQNYIQKSVRAFVKLLDTMFN